MKRKITMLSLMMISFSSITFAQDAIAGGDKDKNGCIGSAGYTYSTIKKDCIRIFEEQIQLRESNPATSRTTIAVVVFSADQKQAEVFMDPFKEGIILNRTGKEGSYIWKKGDLTLSQNGVYQLKRNDKLIYNGM